MREDNDIFTQDTWKFSWLEEKFVEKDRILHYKVIEYY